MSEPRVDEKQLKAAYDAYRRATLEYEKQVARAVPVGSMVTWQHGDHWRVAEVVATDGWEGSLSVKGVTGKVYRLTAAKLVLHAGRE